MTAQAISGRPGSLGSASNMGDDFLARIESTPLRTAPFDHVYVEDLFGPDVYRDLQANLPETRFYRELRHKDAIQPDGTSARREFFLYPEHIRMLPAKNRPFWSEFSRVIRSDALQDVFKRKFKTALEARFGRDIDQLRFYVLPS